MVLASAQLFQIKFEAEAEISSLGANGRIYRLEVTPLDAHVTRKSEEKKGTKVLGDEEAADADPKPGNSEQVGTKSPGGLKDEAPNNYHGPNGTHGKAPDDQWARPGDGSMEEDALYAATNRAKRSAPPAWTENVDRGVSGDAQSRERLAEAVQGGSNPRAEYRRAGDEDRGSNPRQSEPYLDTSTFALTGDSAHNQAMVHWSGHNSSVSSTHNTSRIITVTPTHPMHNADYDYACKRATEQLALNWMCAALLRTAASARSSEVPSSRVIRSSLHSSALTIIYPSSHSCFLCVLHTVCARDVQLCP